jgi:hypothetical protein
MNSTLNFVIVLVVLIIIIRMSGSKRKDHFDNYRDLEGLGFLDNEKDRVNMANMYALDPTGSISRYDISNMPISKNCCPAQYMSDPELKDKNCDYSSKYVANNYSGMNYKDGLGCVCMTPTDAIFYGSIGGNA